MTPTASRRERRRAWRASRNHPDRVGSQAWRSAKIAPFLRALLQGKIDAIEYAAQAYEYQLTPGYGRGTHDARTKAWRSEWR